MQSLCLLLLMSSLWSLAEAGQRKKRKGLCGDAFGTDNAFCDTCLSGSSTVDTQQRGPIQLRDLKLNDLVLTYTPGVGSHFTEVSFTPTTYPNPFQNQW